MSTRIRALLILNGLGLLAVSALVGWVWFFALLGRIELWPLPISIPVSIPNDARAWRMAHMEGITHGLILMALGTGGAFIKLSVKQVSWLFWTSLITAWMFTLPAILNAFFGTRGLAFGGGPFKAGLANDVIYLMGWPPVVSVHIMLGLGVLGVYRYLRSIKSEPAS